MINECPHCGSTKGFTIVKTIRHTELYCFNGECVDVNGETLHENKNIKCFDCNKNIAKIDQILISDYSGAIFLSEVK